MYQGAREGIVDLHEREREPVEVGDPADDRGQVDDVAAAVQRGAGDVELAQIALVQLAALAHPLRRPAVVGDPHLELWIAQQPPDDIVAPLVFGRDAVGDTKHGGTGMVGDAPHAPVGFKVPAVRRLGQFGHRLDDGPEQVDLVIVRLLL